MSVPCLTSNSWPGTSQYDCDFEDDLCSYTQATDDDFDWIRDTQTPSYNTGPSTDHTLGNGE